MQYIYANRNALLDGSQLIIAQMNVCATQLKESAARPKDRNIIAFAVLYPPEPKIVNTKSPPALEVKF